jgi:hypothetical protein
VAFGFCDNSKFATLAIKGIYTENLDSEFQLSDGTYVMSRVPMPDLGIWNEWIGSIRTKQLDRANLVLVKDEASENPQIVDDVHRRLQTELSHLFYFMHLRQGIECADGADLLAGSCERGEPRIRQMSQMDRFHSSKGYRRKPVNRDWLEEAVSMRAGAVAMEGEKSKFRRVIRGLNVLFNGLKETGQDRLHQFVRSLEALILPDVGKTKQQFTHRCQTFAKAGDEARLLLREAFDMRSDTEHLNDWNQAVKNYPPGEQEDVCWHRTRQVEWLACSAYARILQSVPLRGHFETEASMRMFWKLSDDKRRGIWGAPIDLAAEHRFADYDQWQRGVS